MVEQINYVHIDHSKHYLAVDPLFKDPHFPASVMQLGISLDFAKLFAQVLAVNGFRKHSELLEDWIKRISERPVKKEEPSITVSSSSPKWICSADPADTYYRIIGKYTGKEIGKCTGVGIPDVLEEEPGSTFEEITKEEFEAEDD